MTSIGTRALGYTFSNGYILLSDFTLYGYSGSAAETYASDNSLTFVTLPLSAPSSISLSNTSSGIKASWGAVSHATGYQVQHSTSSSFASGNTSKTTASTSYTITGLTSGKTYYVRARAYVTVGGTKYYGSWSSTKSIKYLKASKISSLTNTSSGIKVKWSKVTGASGYYIYRDGVKIKTITSGSTLSYTDTGATTSGTKYKYKIYAYYGSTKSAASAAVATYYVSPVTISSASNSSSKAITIKWKAISKATGYRIWISTSSDFSKNTSQVLTTKTTHIIKKLTKGTTYYIKVQAYKTVSGTEYCAAWSSIKKVKVSK